MQATSFFYNDSLFYQLDAQILYFNTFITYLYMFRAYRAHLQEGNCINTAPGYLSNTPTNAHIVFNNLKFTLKCLKRSYMFRSSSGSILCSLLKLQFKTPSDLLRYINLVLW